MESNKRARTRKIVGLLFLVTGVAVLGGMLILLRLTVVTDFLYHAAVKDPERVAPEGNAIVSPADGTVLYVRRITGGTIPQVIKHGVPVPVVEHIKGQPMRPFRSGYLIGIYMNTQGVHINRVPDNGRVVRQIVFNGPHMDMTNAETRIILTQLVPGLVTLKKIFGLEPFALENDADFMLNSARETLAIEDENGRYLYVVRIADYYVGKILTWVSEGEAVARGQRLGMITWGSQTDLFIEDSPELRVEVSTGDYVYGGETVVATY